VSPPPLEPTLTAIHAAHFAGCARLIADYEVGMPVRLASRLHDLIENVVELRDKVASRIAGVIKPALQTAETARTPQRPFNIPPHLLRRVPPARHDA
jgi:hypothetical protein